MAKNHFVHVRFSNEELNKVKRDAESYSLPLSSYIRMILIRGKVKVESLKLDP